MAFDLIKRAFQALLIQKNLPSRERGLNKKNIVQPQKANIARCAAMKPEKKSESEQLLNATVRQRTFGDLPDENCVQETNS